MERFVDDLATPSRTYHRQTQSQSGFALVTLMMLLPFFCTLFVTLGGALYAMKKRTLAQALCVHVAAQTQAELKSLLQDLLKLNPQATRLRRQRQLADRALKAALASRIPKAIAAAKAVQTAVVAAQAALRIRQEGLLQQARMVREEAQSNLHRKLGRLEVRRVQATLFHPLALAVRPVPPLSPSPDYVPVPNFEPAQQQMFTFRIKVLPYETLEQSMNCALTLTKENNTWTPRVLAASA